MTTSRLCLPCDGIQVVTPQPIVNRPGLDALKYRIGTQATFFESLLARISTLTGDELAELTLSANQQARQRRVHTPTSPSLVEHPLRDWLTTREPTDPAIALLDAWATVADVLTFYQERIANEGFLRTAQHRNSIRELARLVGYRLRPGVASTVYLAFEVDDTAIQIPFGNNPPTSVTAAPVLIPKGTAAKSTPAPGSHDEPQTFETSRELLARKEWNAISPRKTRPTRLTFEDLFELAQLYFVGISLRIAPHDWLIIDTDALHQPTIRQVLSVEPDSDNNRTKVTFRRDALATLQLIEDINKQSNAFLKDVVSSQAGLTNAFVDAIQSRLQKRIEDARQQLDSRRLVGTDEDMHDFICGQCRANLVASPAVTDPIRAGSKAIQEWATAAVNAFDGTPLKVLSTRGILDANYKPLHDLLSVVQNKRVDVIVRLVAAIAAGIGSAPDKVAFLNSLAKAALWDMAFDPTVGQPPCRIAPQARHKPVDGRFAKLANVSTLASRDVTIDSLFLVKQGVDTGPAQVHVADTSTPPNALQNAVSALVAHIDDVPGSRWIKLDIKDSTTGELLATALQEFGKDAQPFSPDFPLLQNEKAVLYRRGFAGQWQLDSDFQLVAAAGATAEYSVTLDVAPAGIGTFAIDASTGFGLNAAMDSLLPIGAPQKTDLQLEQALQKLIFEPADPATFEHAWITVVIKKKIGLNDVPIAAALREVIVQLPTQYPGAQRVGALLVVRHKLAQFQGELTCETSDAALLTARLSTIALDFQNAMNSVNAVRDSIQANDTLAEAMEHSQAARQAWQLQSADSATREFRTECTKFLIVGDNIAHGKTKAQVNNAESQFSGLIGSTDTTAEVFSTLPADLRQSLQDIVNDILRRWSAVAADDIKSVEQARSTLNQKAQLYLTYAKSFDERVEHFAVSAFGELDTRHIAFADRLNRLRGAFDGPFRQPAASTPEDAVKERITSVLTAFREYDITVADKCDERHTLKYLVSAILFETDSANTTPPSNWLSGPPLKARTAGLAPASKAALLHILEAWQGLTAQLTPRQIVPSSQQAAPDLSSIGNVIAALGGNAAANTTGNVDLQQILANIGDGSEFISQLVGQLDEPRRQALLQSLRSIRVGRGTAGPKVYAMRSLTRLYGWNAPDDIDDHIELSDVFNAVASGVTCLQPVPPPPVASQGPDQTTLFGNLASMTHGKALKVYGPPRFNSIVNDADKEVPDRLFLDGAFEKTGTGSVIAIQKVTSADTTPVAYRVLEALSRPRSAYSVKGETTRLVVDGNWWNPSDSTGADKDGFAVVRSTRVFCDPEEMVLAEEPVADLLPDSIQLGEQPNEIILDGPVFGLSVGQPIIIEGHRVALETAAVPSIELGTIAGVKHFIANPDVFNERYVTKILLRTPLQNTYVRPTTSVYANVVEATHGETQREVLGSGDGSKEFQKFLLKRPEVTQVVAPNERGIKSTLVVTVNDVEWTEQESLRDAKSTDEFFVTQTDDNQQRTVLFGDGDQGSRLPTGLENVRAEYRTGLGRKGNVAGGQINQAIGAPLGVKKVNNPLAAKGGADPEPRDQAREHAPLAATALDRLVSVQDYEDFARTYAGIGKASASQIQGAVQVTIAGFDPDPIEQDNPLFGNLQRAFEIFGDPSQQFEVRSREASLLIIAANVKLQPRYEWVNVQPVIRAALLRHFRYERRDLGQDVLLSDAIATVQKVPGVQYVDIDKFDAVKQDEVSNLASRLSDGSLQRRARIQVDLARVTSDADELAYLATATSDKIFEERKAADANYDKTLPHLRSAQLCYLTPDIPDTLILEPIP